MAHWLNPSGGILYHLRAYRYSRSLWLGFHQSLDAWLTQWTPVEDTCLLVGPSGGYSLSETFLSRFTTLIVIEPDPIARLAFRARHSNTLAAAGVRLRTQDEAFPIPGSLSYCGIESTRRFLDRHPGCSVLYCNLLGQARVLASSKPGWNEEAWEREWSLWKTALPKLLQGRSYATYHDRLSGPIAPRLESLASATQQPLDTSRIGEAGYTTPSTGSISGAHPPIELNDHGMDGLFPELPRSYFTWELVPGQHHLIEAMRSP